jgi:hypothetical protein
VTLPTDAEVHAHQAAWDAERDQEFYADIPAGFAEAKAEHEKWHDTPFTRRNWTGMSFGDQAYYVRGGRRSPDEWMPDKGPLAKMAEALSLTPSPSIISGYRVWAFDLLDWLDRQGWKLVRK